MSDQFPNRPHDIHAAIKSALLNDWDPIGVKDIPNAESEYDGYVSELYNMIVQGKSKREIIDCLWWIEIEHMGLPGNRQATESFTEKLLSLSPRSRPPGRDQ